MNTTPTSIQMTDSTKEIIRIACAHYNMTRSQLIQYALRTVCAADGIILPTPADGTPVPVITSKG